MRPRTDGCVALDTQTLALSEELPSAYPTQSSSSSRRRLHSGRDNADSFRALYIAQVWHQRSACLSPYSCPVELDVGLNRYSLHIPPPSLSLFGRGAREGENAMAKVKVCSSVSSIVCSPSRSLAPSLPVWERFRRPIRDG